MSEMPESKAVKCPCCGVERHPTLVGPPPPFAAVRLQCEDCRGSWIMTAEAVEERGGIVVMAKLTYKGGNDFTCTGTA